MTRLICFVFVLCILASEAYAGNGAGIMMVPTRVILGGNDRYTTIVIKNSGDAPGNYHVELVDMKMLEDGGVVPIAPGESSEYSASPYLRIAPRSMTLRPGETQYVRLIVRKPEGLAPGEYRAHVKVEVADDKPDAETASAGRGPSIAVKTNLAIIAPVILRNGNTTVSVRLQAPRLVRDVQGNLAVELYVARDGTGSATGDVVITHYPPKGAPYLPAAAKVVKVLRGVSVYRSTPRRLVSVPLDETPKGVDLSHGRLGIAFVAEKREGGKELAETALELR